MNKTELIAVRCKPEEKEILKRYAENDYMPVSAFLLKVAMQYIKEQEDKDA